MDQGVITNEGRLPTPVLDSEAAETAHEMENVAHEQQDLHTGRLPSFADGE
jgi:hypothetical protein